MFTQNFTKIVNFTSAVANYSQARLLFTNRVTLLLQVDIIAGMIGLSLEYFRHSNLRMALATPRTL